MSPLNVAGATPGTGATTLTRQIRDLDHPFLAEIVKGVAADGSHIRAWAELRSTLFPGPTGWLGLKEWCAVNALECALCFGASSKATEVQFSRRRPGAIRDC